MSRWHNGTCQSPDVYIAGDSIPCCRGCGSSAATMLQSMEQTASNPFLPPPPDEPTGKMNLTWPPTVRYVRIQPDGKAVEIERPSPRDEDRLLEQASTSTVSGDTRHQSQVAMQSSPTYEVALAPDEFRLICLSAVDNESTSHLLHLNLEVYQDHNCPDYEATSYTWGGEDNDSELCHPIYIGDYWDILLQTKNSWAMLQYLRPKRGIRLVWVDAICINQNDTTERDNQVAKMGQIYSQCSQVVVWLGSDLVLQTPGVYPRRYRLSELRDLASLRLLNQEEGHTLPQQKLNIARLLERRYFSRVWVIQELILAPRLIIPIGDMVFWADAATLMNQEIVTNWSLEGTKAPWFEHLARGSFRVDSFLELMALTSKSQATDDRDRLFGVLGLYEKKEGEFALRPDYSLSFQHVFVGFFAYYIVNQQKFQLLSKATGVSQGRSSLTWMPEWRSRDSWEQTFQNFHKVYEQPEANVVAKAAETLLKDRSELTVFPLNGSLVYLTREQQLQSLYRSGARHRRYKKSVHEKRPWNRNSSIDTDTGTLSLELVRLSSIDSCPIFVGDLRLTFPGLSLYRFQPRVTSQATSTYHYIASTVELDQVEQNDEIFILNPAPLSPLVYLVLRRTGGSHDFKLIAYCPFLFFGKRDLASLGDFQQIDAEDTNTIGLGLLQRDVAEDIDIISTELDLSLHEKNDIFASVLAIFPDESNERISCLKLWSLLPLFLASARENAASRFGDVEQRYLMTIQNYLNFFAFFAPQRRPRIIADFVHFSFGPGEFGEMCLGDFVNVSRPLVWEYLSTLKTWENIEQEDSPFSNYKVFSYLGSRSNFEITLRCKFDQIHAVIRSLAPRGLFELYKAGLLGVSDSDVEARIRAGPVEEDFNTPSPFRDEEFEHFRTRNGLDGRTYQVHIL